MICTLNTKMVALLGNPLGQSFASKMQNPAYKELGLEWFYLPIEIPTPEAFREVLAGMRHMNLAGLAITKPYKVEVMQYLDEIDDLAKKMGSCNTIKIDNGVWKGYNTDGIGAIRSLVEEGGVDIPNSSFFSFGAGGTARSLCFELAARGAKRIVLSSRSDTSQAVADEINRFFPGVCYAVRITDMDTLLSYLRESNVVLNLSGSGMAPHLDETPIDQKFLSPNQICFDAVYNPAKTRFLVEAEEIGCKIVNGLGMTIYQGARQVALWANIDDPVEIMRRTIQSALS